MRNHINVIECAMMVQRSTETLAAWRKKGVGPAWIKNRGGRIMYVLQSVEAFTQADYANVVVEANDMAAISLLAGAITKLTEKKITYGEARAIYFSCKHRSKHPGRTEKNPDGWTNEECLAFFSGKVPAENSGYVTYEERYVERI